MNARVVRDAALGWRLVPGEVCVPELDPSTQHSPKRRADRLTSGGQARVAFSRLIGVIKSLRVDRPHEANAHASSLGLRIIPVLTRPAEATRVRVAAIAFACVVLLPVLRRVLHPTVFGDDLLRLSKLIEFPLRQALFRPFAEHVTPLFDLVSWITWQAIGHDLRIAPLGYSIASVIPWLLLLLVLGRWLVRDSGSVTAALIAISVVASSPLVVETIWWYSASSFAWASLGILLALLGAAAMPQRPVRSLFLIGLGTALAPAGTFLGHLAMPLVTVRILVEPSTSRRRKFAMIVAGLTGLATYVAVCAWGGSPVISTARTNNMGLANPLAGLRYAFCVPGWVLAPTAIGIPPSWSALVFRTASGPFAGIVVLVLLLGTLAWPKTRWNRSLVATGAVMIYLGYTLAYVGRAGFVTRGLWPEASLIYLFASRYHVVPILGLAAVLAAMLAPLRLIRWCDARPGLPQLAGTLVGLVVYFLHDGEIEKSFAHMLRHPDQAATLSALDRVGVVAREEGVTQSQLDRVTTPVSRTWNEGIRTWCPENLSLMKLIDAPKHPRSALSDDQVRALLHQRLTRAERVALGAGACAYLKPGKPSARTAAVATAQRVGQNGIEEVGPGLYRAERPGGFIRFEFPATIGARYLTLPGLACDQDVVITRCTPTGVLRPRQTVIWAQPRQSPATPVVDLANLVHWWHEPITQIAIQIQRPGELYLPEPPRLLR